MKKLLVPTDFTPASHNALEVALQIAKKSGEDTLIYLLNVIDLKHFHKLNNEGQYVDALTDNAYRDHLIHDAGVRLQSLMVEAATSSLVARVETGEVTEVINQYVAQEKIDLVVLGAKTTSLQEEMLFFSTTDRVIRTLTCPVLTIRRKNEDFKAQNMVLATNLTDPIEEAAPQIKAMQKLFGATLHLVYINTPGDFYNNSRIQDMKNEFVAKYGFENYTFTIYNDFTIETGIAHFAEDANADILAISARHLNDTLDYVANTFRTEIIMDEVSRPVLTFSR
ncbi:MAG: universal stress protein [Microscillaceae bacterium]